MRVRAIGEAIEPHGGEGGGGGEGEGGGGTGGGTLRLRGGGAAGGGDTPTAHAQALEHALGWSDRQSHILTGGGVAETLYTSARGFSYRDDELPHYHLRGGSTHSAFATWAAEAEGALAAGASGTQGATPEWLAGVWARPLFSGGGLTSTNADETCVNLISPHGPFIDIRIPTARDDLLGGPASPKWQTIAAAVAEGAPRPLASLSDTEVRTRAASHERARDAGKSCGRRPNHHDNEGRRVAAHRA